MDIESLGARQTFLNEHHDLKKFKGYTLKYVTAIKISDDVLSTMLANVSRSK
jgi:hypothetical protein